MNNRLIGIFVVLIIVIGFAYFFIRKNSTKPEYHRSVKVLIKQISENNLNLEELKVEPIYSSASFNNSQLKKYYQVKLLTKNQKLLYTTQVPKQYLVSRFTYPEYEPALPIVKNNTDISLYLPFYNQAEKIVIEDELGNTIMSINLKNLDIPSFNQENLCGNGICDKTESRFTCGLDCL